MTKFCIECGASLPDGVRFCGDCGHHVAADAAPVASAGEVPRIGPNWLLIGGIGSVLLILGLYYVIFLRDDVGSRQDAPTQTKVEVAEVIQVQFFAVADANIRDRATTVGTAIIGKLPRGQAASGVMTTGEDGEMQWLKLADNNGFVAASNLSEDEPPKIAKMLGDKIWNADKAMEIYAEPEAGSVPIDSVKAGAPLTLFGLTANDYIEIKLKRGGVGYIAEGARIVALTLVKGKPIAIAFNPASCNFGGELEAEFAKLTAKSRAAYKAIDMTDFASDAARDKALIGFEGKSYFQRLERSFNGLSITGIAQHYESQSVYFADRPDKVLAAFKAAGYKIGRDGQFANTEIYAGIGATAGEGRTVGKSDLSCGV